MRELLRRYLSEHDFIVSVASDAADARTILSGITFDLLVLDVMMPGEDGLSLTQSIRRDSDTPILLLTARGEVEDRIARDRVNPPDVLCEIIAADAALWQRGIGG